MHLEVKNSFLEFDINQRVKIERKVLVDIFLESENPILAKREMEIILGWLSKKYSRPAFPDTFNKLVKDIPKIDRKLANINHDFQMIKRLFFSLDPEQEISPSETYSLSIYILLKGLSFESDKNLKDSIVPRFVSLFTVERISLREVTCVFEDEMTMYDLGIFKVWDKEYITLRNGFPN